MSKKIDLSNEEKFVVLLRELLHYVNCLATTPDENNDVCGVSFTCSNCRKRAEVEYWIKRPVTRRSYE